MNWWVIPEGTAGRVIGQLVQNFQHGVLGASGGAGIGSLYTVTQSATKPAGAVAGPFATQQEAQAEADKLNATGTSSTQPTAANAAASAQSAFGIGGLFQSNIWLRVAEVAIGVILLGIGLNAMLKGKPLQVVTGTVGGAAKMAALA